MLRPRIIPCLLIHKGGLVKTQQFKDPKYVGDPINAVRIFNEMQPRAKSKLFSKGFEDLPQFYFLHSYFFDAEDKQDVAATANYGLDFDAVVSRGHIHGVQCHPEKSHHWGEQLLKNFVEL